MKKKQILICWYLVLLGGILFVPGCKTSDLYDITGTWEITISDTAGDTKEIFVFQGSESEGTLYDSQNEFGNGTYSVTGINVTFSYSSNLPGGRSYTFTGSFTGRNRMSGTATITQALPPPHPFEWEADWTAVRQETR